MSSKAKLGEFMKMLTEMSFQLFFKKGHRFGRSVGMGNAVTKFQCFCRKSMVTSGLEMWAANR